jgi:hypothetical protein
MDGRSSRFAAAAMQHCRHAASRSLCRSLRFRRVRLRECPLRECVWGAFALAANAGFPPSVTDAASSKPTRASGKKGLGTVGRYAMLRPQRRRISGFAVCLPRRIWSGANDPQLPLIDRAASLRSDIATLEQTSERRPTKSTAWPAHQVVGSSPAKVVKAKH